MVRQRNDTVFADASFFVALLSEHDENHLAADFLLKNSKYRIVTTAWILSELAAYFSRADIRYVYLEFHKSVVRSIRLEVVPPDAHQFDEGMKLYVSRPDKSWSLFDCISFNLMEERGIYRAWTADHHFEQAGFEAFLRIP